MPLMSTVGLVGLAFLFPVMAFLVLVLRLGHPHHRRIAVGLYALGWIPFIASIWRHRELLAARKAAVEGMFDGHGIHIAALVGLILIAYVGRILFPPDRTALGTQDDTAIAAVLAADTRVLHFVDDKLTSIVAELDAHPDIGQPEADISGEDAVWLRAWWGRFMDASYELDLLKYRYRSFYQFSLMTQRALHHGAFMASYGAYVSQYTAGLVLTRALGDNGRIRKILNEAQPDQDLPAGGFAAIQKRSVHPDTVLRLNAGRAYLQIVAGQIDEDAPVLQTTRAHLAHIDRIVEVEPSIFIENPLDYLEHKALETWFPVQKSIAVQMSKVRVASRPYFIQPEMLTGIASVLNPGDILLMRREWHLTNLGIPGYWTHAALYIGTPDQLDRYFADLLDGETASQHLQRCFPEAHAQLSTPDEHGYPRAIIEAMRPGVILTSLEISGGTDALVALRPRVPDADRLTAIETALSHLGKPYDFDFDFTTEHALVCSQLVHLAYADAEGLRLEPKLVSGRLLLPPNDIAMKFDAELDTPDQQMDLALFLDGRDEAAVERGDADAFRSTWRRPKWHIVFA
jgi:hypothetical protein